MQHTIQELMQRQRMPLQAKVLMSKARIREWVNEYGEDGVYVSFSGGKDSTVLLHLVREEYPGIKAMFIDTGLEYPEIREFVKTFDNVDIVKPKLTFKQVIERYGYPMISKEVSKDVFYARSYLSGKTKHDFHYKKLTGQVKNKDGEKSMFCYDKYQFFLDAPFEISYYCCDVMKKYPAHGYDKQTGRKPMTAMLAKESKMRTTQWLLHGCNAFDNNNPISNPLAFWTDQDILGYIRENNVKICSVYGDIVGGSNDDELPGQMDFSDFGLMEGTKELKTTGCKRTGCMFCGYGCHFEKEGEGRFQLMKETHPKIYDYVMRPLDQGGLGYKEVIDWINNHSDIVIRY